MRARGKSLRLWEPGFPRPSSGGFPGCKEQPGPFCFPAGQQGGGDGEVCVPCSPRTGPAGRQWVLRKHPIYVLVCALGLQETGWERSLPGQPRDPLPTPHLGGGPLAPPNPEKVPRPPPPARPSPGLPGRLLGTSGAGRGSPGPRQQPRANTTIVFPPGASKGRLAAKPGGSGEPPAGAGGTELQPLRPQREVDGAGWHSLSLDLGCPAELPSALCFIREMGTPQPGWGPHAKALEQCLALDEGSRNALRDRYGYKASFLPVAVLMLTPRLR